MIFCVFSFNRGRFLKNCISSIESCAPNHTIAIFDDNSNDPETIKILQSYKEKYKIYQPDASIDSKHHLGGLYGNMQRAFEEYSEADLLCYLQDDTQLVRPIDDQDIAVIQQTFENSPSLGFISPCFIRGINLTKGAQYSYNKRQNLYFKEQSKHSSGTYFSALLITKPNRLINLQWSFLGSEPKNDGAAKEKFSKLGYLFAPFAMWLPEVPAYRGKNKTLGLKLAEKKRKCGYYPYSLMTKKEIDNLQKRPHADLPIAENFLQCESYEPPKPWSYNPLTTTKFLKKLNQIEVIARRQFN
ncbi:MAG: glycosyltransferase [Bacteroidota bacterium]